jgi:hypothetical protein
MFDESRGEMLSPDRPFAMKRILFEETPLDLRAILDIS